MMEDRKTYFLCRFLKEINRLAEENGMLLFTISYKDPSLKENSSIRSWEVFFTYFFSSKVWAGKRSAS